MNTMQIITARLISAHEQIVKTGTSKERRFSLRKLIEIAQSCPDAELASKANKVLVNYPN